MHDLLKRPSIYFSFLGFFFSLGGPLGFYIHDFLINNEQGVSLQEHIQLIHSSKLSTVIYIGLGCNVFFTLFGHLLGRMHEKMQNQQAMKQSLMKHFLNQTRLSTRLGMEGLLYLKSDSIDANDKIEIINNSLERLEAIDKDIENLIQFSHEDHQGGFPIDELKEKVRKTSLRYELESSLKLENQRSDLTVVASEASIQMALEIIYEWAKQNEIEGAEISLHHAGEETHLLFKFPQVKVGQGFKSAFLFYIMEKSNGECRIENDTIKLTLPVRPS